MESKTFKVTITAESADMLPSAETFQGYLSDVSVDGETYVVEEYKEEASG